jgi:chemotaxis protein MotB
MVKQALIIASFLSAAVVIGVVGYSAYQQKTQLQAVQTQLAQATLLNTNKQAQIEELLKEKEQVTKAQTDMEKEMRDALQTKEVTISQLKGKLTVNILDRILFASGEAELKPEGEAVLKQIAGVLTNYPTRQIYVIGHTDNVPIRAASFSRFTSNWELSTARATAAVRYLSEKADVDPKRLAAVGYGEFHPIAENTTAEGKAHNRRIAIVVVPEQFNPLELQDAGNTNAPMMKALEKAVENKPPSKAAAEEE